MSACFWQRIILRGEKKMAAHKKIIKDIILHTVKLTIVLLSFQWALQPQGPVAQFLGKDLSYLLPPIFVLSIILYISSIIRTIFAMKIAEIVGYALNGLALALALYLIILTPLAPKLLYLMNFWLFICMLIVIFNYVAKSLADLYHEPVLGILSNSIALFLTGITLSNILTILMSPLSLPPKVSEFIPIIIFWTFTATSILLTATLLKYFPNPYLHYFGEKISSNITGITFLLILVPTYFFILKPYILSYYYRFIPMPIDIFEWGMICFLFWLFYNNIKGQVSKRFSEQLNLGDWTRLEQEIEHRIDLEQRNIANLVEEFVEYGMKDGIITYLTSIMLLNGVKETYIRGIIKKVLDFQETPYPKICLRSWIARIDEENRRRRMKLIEEVLEDMKFYWRGEVNLEKQAMVNIK